MKLLHASLILLFILSGCESEDSFSDQIKDAKQFDLSKARPAELVRDREFSAGSYETVNNMGPVVADDAGNVYVVDEHRTRIQIFDASGNDLGSLGSIGRDPGDFQNPGYLKVQGDHLYAYDQNLFRSYRYTLPELELEAVTELENTVTSLGVDSLSAARPFKFEVMEDGNYLVGFQIVESPQERELVFYKVDPAGEVISDQLFAYDSKKLYVDEATTPPLIMMLPYEPETLTATDSKQQIYTTFTEHFLINITDSVGENIESRYYPFSKHKLIRSDAIDLYRDTFQRRAIRRASLPDTWPALADIKTDDQDRLWVAAIIPNLNKYRWYVLESSGEPLATFGLSREKNIEVIKGEYVYIKAYNSRRYSDEVLRYRLDY
ncbi:MAG: hypothetical protein WD357_01855 [Gracilimonas sp.]